MSLRKTLKYISFSILSVLAFIVIVGLLFITLSPQFGGTHTEEDIKRYTASGHYDEGEFINLTTTTMDMNMDSIWSTLREFMAGVPNDRPARNIEVLSMEVGDVVNNDTLTRVTWFGHSAFLVEMAGKKILLDPMLGDVPAPHPWLGQSRYSKELPISIEDMPHIDAVFISHDHYDHLDYESIEKLKGKVDQYYLPLGVGAHFRAWGIPEEKIHELNWWDEAELGNIKLAFTPSRHFSGRGLTDRNATLWGSWVLITEKDRLYFSGDGGYGTHFKEIGEKYGPFDLGMMECGQYNVKWAQIHMLPEESAQAAVDINAKLMMPIHWGAFTLALHSWTDPVVRVKKKADELNMPISTPRIGEPIVLHQEKYPISSWWENYL
ncbi:MBL fold metallo-hydrolase [Flammeovirga sp. SubArs3]|uniref:MBL fold metallo-hydrolase n=1 Tax=Flammeovirga sp. SubArs3 TaxID=2995316 RepID=UPI00248BDB83|nr:MBL fold metallo-hydrolase [Flammeovirga sp. SubArs3]